MVGGAIAGVLISHSDLKSAAIAASIGAISSLLPDIDSPYSKVGRAVPILPMLLNFSLGHRGIIHSPVAVLAVYLLTHLFNVPYANIIVAGYFSHLVLDGLNPAGVPWLYPWKKLHFGIPIIQTGSFIERFIFMPVLLLIFGSVLINLT
ncbi:metal-dependent hydrolase [Desulforamulus putei]|uniref:metal-dependent hydrolase n=1 Tax=Desulforamulus putei TaxID=74701 RepID=UPI000A004FEF|nr:metal-dependent hydrolase [Desulforamulus putei]